ncbi:MAG TPA: hypothetical protein VHT28_05835 [Silvibacterium sp.]|nr:hypothetical protein [Silvibacterium sp.]
MTDASSENLQQKHPPVTSGVSSAHPRMARVYQFPTLVVQNYRAAQTALFKHFCCGEDKARLARSQKAADHDDPWSPFGRAKIHG